LTEYTQSNRFKGNLIVAHNYSFSYRQNIFSIQVVIKVAAI